MLRPRIILLGALGVLGLCLAGGHTPSRIGRRAQIVRAWGACRPTEAQLTGGFPPAPWKAGVCLPADWAALERIDHEVRKALDRNREPETVADAGLLKLLAGRIDESIKLFEESISVGSTNPVRLSDLAVAYFIRSCHTNEARLADRVTALKILDEALALDSSLEEIKFNRALALEYLFLSSDAQQAWEDYLRSFPSSPWKAEASRRLGQLRQLTSSELWTRQEAQLSSGLPSSSEVRKIVQVNRQPARLYSEVTLLGRWAEAEARGSNAQALSALALAREIGQDYAELSGDPMLSDTVATIDAAYRNGSQKRLHLLVEGHRVYEAAYGFLYDTSGSGKSKILFQAASQKLLDGGSPFWRWAALFTAVCEYQESQYGLALAILDKIDVKRYTVLQGRVEWLRGLIQEISASSVAAQKSYLTALQCFRAAGEVENEAAIHHLLFEVHYLLGNTEEAWAEIYLALSRTPQVLDPRRRQAIYQGVAEAAQQIGQYRTALYFENEALRIAYPRGRSNEIVLILRERARLSQGAGKVLEALKDLEEAQRLARQAGDEQLQSEVLLSEGALLATSDREGALRAFSEALPLLQRTNYDVILPNFYLERGKLRAAAGDQGGAESDFRAGIAEVERARTDLVKEFRTPYFDQHARLFDEMVRLLIDQGRHEEAYRYCELSHNRLLAEELASTGVAAVPEVADLKSVQSSLPDHMVLVEYTVLSDRTLVWTFQNHMGKVISLPSREADFHKLVSKLRSAVKVDLTAFALTSRDLFRRLIQPLDLHLSSTDSLVFVLDKSLRQLPMAALQDPLAGHFLVEEYPVTIAPSAGLLLARSLHKKIVQRRELSALVIGNPSFDRTLAAELPSLPAAQSEAELIAGLYPRSLLLTGQEATKDRFLGEIGKYSVIHFGGHAEVNTRAPLFSRLLLAAFRSDPGVLFAHELYRSFPGTRLVFLAACNSAAGRISETEGMEGLAHPFLAGGVPAVIGTLWAVDDTAAALFAEEFHRAYLRGGGDAAAALQRTQLVFIKHPEASLRSPATWAAFELLGDSCS